MILAIDLGSTNFKAALFDPALKRLGTASVPTPYSRDDGDYVEMDAVTVQDTVIHLIQETCQIAGTATRSITSVAVSSQAASFTLLNGDGKFVCPDPRPENLSPRPIPPSTPRAPPETTCFKK